MNKTASGDFLQWLHTFILVSETGSVHRAADKLCLSPSAISHHIKKLENELDIILFERKNNGMQLTQEGRQAMDSSLPILEAVWQLRSNKAKVPTLVGPIRITCVNRFAHYLIPDILAFRKLHPDVTFSLDPTSPKRVLKNISQGLFDMAITVYSRLPGHLKSTLLRPSSAYLYTPPGNPFKLKEKPSWEEICSLPIIALTLEGYVNPVVSSLPEINIYPKNVIISLNDFILALQLVKAGVGVCIATKLTPLESAEDYSIFNIDHIFPIGTYGIVTRQLGYLPIQSRAFITYLKKQYALRGESTDGSFPTE